MIEFRRLNDITNEILHKAFLEVFSDYQVKVNLPFWKFNQMLKRKGFNPQLSIGAFENENLVGFILNGLRDWKGKKTVYDIGTGVIAEYRRQGITSDMIFHIKDMLKENKVEQYLLEVLKPNQSAVELYKKQGFKVQREFSCFKLDKNKFVPITNFKVDNIANIDFYELTEFWDFEPSWQNSVASVCAVHEDFLYSSVSLDNKIVGYGIIDKRTGDIPQIAVNKNYRNIGVASSIITELIKNTESQNVNLTNVDSSFKNIENFLLKIGFSNFIGQYEMLLKL